MTPLESLQQLLDKYVEIGNPISTIVLVADAAKLLPGLQALGAPKTLGGFV